MIHPGLDAAIAAISPGVFPAVLFMEIRSSMPQNALGLLKVAVGSTTIALLELASNGPGSRFSP